ncbi:MAG: hypothetical protein GX677_10160 [Treponema sp.]|jgi:hypothetical protein|nr:hypothetical protein [Treponema sp.]
MKTIPAMLDEGKNEDEVLEYVFQRCPTLQWSEIKENKKTILSSYNDKSFRKIYNESNDLRKQIINGERNWLGESLSN